MHKRKHLLKLILMNLIIILVVFGSTGSTASAETESNISSIIDLTGIMKNSNGNPIMKKTYVNRKEFAQMLVQASPYAGEIKSTNQLKLFKDVPKNTRQSAYIQIAVTKGYMSGYLGGKFKPSKAVTFQEAVYSTLCLLGYSKDDFVGQLSDARYDKFKELGLSKNLSCSESDKLTKEDCEILFYNLLNAKQKNGEIYGKSLGYSLNSEDKVDYQSIFVKIVKGPYVAKDGWREKLTSELYSYNILLNGEAITFADIKDNDIVYYAEQAKTIWVYNDKIYGTLDNIVYSLGEPQELTISGTNYAVENSKEMKKTLKNSSIQVGMPVVLLLGLDDKASKILKLSGIVAEDNWQLELTFDIGQGTIYKNGAKVSSSDIESTDVIYYSNELKTLWIYDEKEYGVLEEISPNLSAPESIVVAGKTYYLELHPLNSSKKASNEVNLVENVWGDNLQTNGVSEGDNVVVLFGCNGKVADVRTVSEMPVTIIGYVLSLEKKVTKDENQYSTVKQILRIVDTGGTVREFPCNEFAFEKGNIVEVTFKNGSPIITKIGISSSAIPSDITSKMIAKDARIIDVKDTSYSKLTISELKESNYNVGTILYYKLNSSDELTDLILYNASDSLYQFGLLKKVSCFSEEAGSFYYEFIFDIGGTETTISTDLPQWNFTLGPKILQFSNNQLKDMQNMKEVSIAYISGKQANTGDAVYRITDDVIVYFYKNGEYYKGTLSDATNTNNCRVLGYVNQSQGPIRIIIVSV